MSYVVVKILMKIRQMSSKRNKKTTAILKQFVVQNVDEKRKKLKKMKNQNSKKFVNKKRKKSF